jgi:predicted unusual protein kinase regulating ubiquinone biosynthesis (AarF/ABC1/UbiB family)
MMGTIQPASKERLVALFGAITRKEVDVVLQSLIELGIVAPTGGDTLSIRRALAYFLDNIGRQAEQQETVAAIGEDLFALAIDSPFRFPAAFTFVLRAFATLEGIGKALDPQFSFAQTAAPYAQELLELQGARAQGAFALDTLREQAAEAGAAAAALPRRVARIDAVVGQLEAGDLRLRVRVLEGERAARRAGAMQLATLHAVASLGLLNVGTQLALGGREGAASAAMGAAAVFAGLVVLGLRRVRRLDKFEDGIKGRGSFPSN